jgi:hypothetical protein
VVQFKRKTAINPTATRIVHAATIRPVPELDRSNVLGDRIVRSSLGYEL